MGSRNALQWSNHNPEIPMWASLLKDMKILIEQNITVTLSHFHCLSRSTIKEMGNI